VIVSIRSLLPVGDGRIEAAVNLPEAKYNALLDVARLNRTTSMFAANREGEHDEHRKAKRKRVNSSEEEIHDVGAVLKETENMPEDHRRLLRDQGGVYSVSEAQAAYSHLSDYHKKKGWDTSGWWARKG
jgi:ubiquitin-conjugating enzyme E2 Q